MFSSVLSAQLSWGYLAKRREKSGKAKKTYGRGPLVDSLANVWIKPMRPVTLFPPKFPRLEEGNKKYA